MSEWLGVPFENIRLVQSADVPERPHAGLLQECGELAQLPGALAHGAIGETSMLAEKDAVGAQRGLKPCDQRPRHRAGNSSTKMSLLVRLQ